MTREELDTLWQKALIASVRDGELYTRYHFAALVQKAEREACAKVCDKQGVGRKALEHYAALTYSGAAHDCAAAIRARGEV